MKTVVFWYDARHAGRVSLPTFQTCFIPLLPGQFIDVNTIKFDQKTYMSLSLGSGSLGTVGKPPACAISSQS
jgi:hypothetical protein